jgi:hypothetical protein
VDTALPLRSATRSVRRCRLSATVAVHVGPPGASGAITRGRVHTHDGLATLTRVDLRAGMGRRAAQEEVEPRKAVHLRSPVVRMLVGLVQESFQSRRTRKGR